MSKKRAAEDLQPEDMAVQLNQEQVAALEFTLENLPPPQRCVGPILETLLKAYNASNPPHKKSLLTRQATDFKSVKEAARALQIDYEDDDPSYVFELKSEQMKICGKLSQPYAAVINDLKHNPYLRMRQDEAFCRTVIDLIIVDRLNDLKDSDATYRFQMSAEVPISVRTRDIFGQEELVRGRADWALGYGSTKNDTGTILVVAEAKMLDAASVGLPQLVVYMAAIQDARKHKINRSVFGMLSDSKMFSFAFLDEDRKFFVSEPLMWAKRQDTIIAYIDMMLLSAIESSPNTTPQKSHNRTIYNYRKALGRKWAFGDDADDEKSEDQEEESEGEDSWTVVKDGERVVMRKTTKWQGPSREEDT